MTVRRDADRVVPEAAAATGKTTDWYDGSLEARGAQRRTWAWRPGIEVSYAYAKHSSEDAVGEEGAAVLLLHGFGVASFHYEAQLAPLAEAGYTVYAMDYIGAGLSWPTKDVAPGSPVSHAGIPGIEWGFGKKVRPEYEDLVIGEGLWKDQLIDFIRDCIRERRIYLCGNSLGGYLAALAAAEMEGEHRERVAGVVLLNATPFWGFTPNPSREPFLHQLVPWRGQLPIPWFARLVSLLWYNSLRSAPTIEGILGMVTARPGGVGSELATRIATMASHPGGGAAFAQILWAPRSSMTFDEALDILARDRMPVLMLYGQEDPWVNPQWGQRAFAALPEATYLQLSPSGHCPHFETPCAVNEVMLRWLSRTEGSLAPEAATARLRPGRLPLTEGDGFDVLEDDGIVVRVTRVGKAQIIRDGRLALDEFWPWLWNALSGRG